MNKLIVTVVIYYGLGFQNTALGGVQFPVKLFRKTDPQFEGVYHKTESENEFGIRHTIDSLNY